MKYFKTQKTFKASNVTLKIDREAKEIEAYSYGWWKFVAVINGKVVFNDHAYSPSTRGHQRKARKVLAAQGISIDHVIDSRAGLNDGWSVDALNCLHDKIAELTKLIETKGTRKEKNEERKKQIEEFKAKIEEIKTI
jgi:hypothetical protein